MEITVFEIIENWVNGCLQIGVTNCNGSRHTYFETVDIEGNRVTQPKEMEVAFNQIRMVLPFKKDGGEFGRIKIYDFQDINNYTYYYFASKNERTFLIFLKQKKMKRPIKRIPNRKKIVVSNYWTIDEDGIMRGRYSFDVSKVATAIPNLLEWLKMIQKQVNKND